MDFVDEQERALPVPLADSCGFEHLAQVLHARKNRRQLLEMQADLDMLRTLVLNGDGSYSYALDNASQSIQSLAEGQVVTETFAYQASDGIVSTPSTLTVSITGTNDAPMTTVDTAAVQETSHNIQVYRNQILLLDDSTLNAAAGREAGLTVNVSAITE